MRKTDSCRKSERRWSNASSSYRVLPVPLSSSSAVTVHAAKVLSAFTLTTLVLLSPVVSARAAGVVSGCTEAALRTALTGGGIVSFTNNCTITIAQQIAINQADTTIDAAGHTVLIGASNAVPLFDVTTNLVLRGLSLVNGAGTNSGAALYIHPGAFVTASSCIFAGNSVVGTNGLAGNNGATNSTSTGGNGSSGSPGDSGLGGAIYNSGSLALVNCTLTNNSATGGTGGRGGTGGTGAGTFTLGGNGGDGAAGGSGLGGAIYNLGELTLINCTFSANSVAGGNGSAGGAGGAGSSAGPPGNGGGGGGGFGGAVFNAMNLTALASTFSANSAHGGTSAPAGVRRNGTGLHGIKGAQADGGALYNQWWAVVTNSTFYANTVVGGAGGNGGNGGGTFAIPGDGGDGGDGFGGALENANTITIVNCTFSSNGALGGTNGVPGSGNYAGANGKFGQSNGGNIANNTSVILTLMNSILASSASGANEFGSFTDGGYNLSSDSASSFGGTSLQNTNPELGRLASYGGPTLTMALLSNSPAIDVIPPSACPPTDQRGIPRPLLGKGDVGAYEYEFVGAPKFVQQPLDQKVPQASTVTFTVIVVGAAPLTFQWYYNGELVPNLFTNSMLSGVVTNWITITNVQRFLEGTYLVEVTNSVGNLLSDPAVLQVALDGFAVQALRSSAGARQTNLDLAFQTDLWFNYAVEFKNSLADSNWILIDTQFGTGGFVTNSVPTTNGATGFYRIRAY